MNISELLEEYLAAHPNLDAHTINNGMCEDFAMFVCDRLPGAELIGGEDIGDWFLVGHVWIRYNGLHYDSECTTGVDDPHKLPIFSKHIH